MARAPESGFHLLSDIIAPTPISRLQAHYFAVYAVFGCITPYIPIYLRDVKHLCASEIGLTFATGQAAVLIMPVLLTYLADRFRLVRPLLLTMFLINIAALTAMIGAAGFWPCLTWIALNRMVTHPQITLADGIYFSLQSDPTQPRAPYAAVRVWGTIGYIAPSLVIYTSYYLGDFCKGGLEWVPYVAGGFAILGLLNAFRLPPRYNLLETAQPPPRVPTLAAARVLLRPRLSVFLVGVGFVVMSNMAFYSFYPLYLTTEIGIGERWVGLISSLGVAIEILYILRLEPLRRRIGFGGLLVIGGLASLFRLACLAFLPTPFFSIVFQLVHGLTVIGYMIVPVMYLNTHAGEGYRNSIQGVYVMVIQGVFSIAGNILAGHLAEIGLLTLYRAALGICALGLLLVAISFRLKDQASDATPR